MQDYVRDTGFDRYRKSGQRPADAVRRTYGGLRVDGGTSSMRFIKRNGNADVRGSKFARKELIPILYQMNVGCGAVDGFVVERLDFFTKRICICEHSNFITSYFFDLRDMRNWSWNSL